MNDYLIDTDVDNISSDCQKFNDPKNSRCESLTTIDSPTLKSLSQFQPTQHQEIYLFENNLCQKFIQGSCLDGLNCTFPHIIKNVEEIINQNKSKKYLTLIKQFPEILILRNIRTNSFLF